MLKLFWHGFIILANALSKIVVVDIMLKNKNPLSLALGAFLKVERKKLGIRTAEVAKTLELGHSFYRMIESGSANFSPSRTFHLIKLLSEYNINVDKLAKYIIGIQLVESHFDKEDKNSSRVALLELGKFNDEDFNVMIDEILYYYSLDDAESEKMEDVITSKFRELIFNFLTKGQNVETGIDALINKTPSQNMSLVYDLLKGLQHLTPSHFASIASRWEDDNKHIFTHSSGIFKNSESIINENNFRLFTYDYLESDEFKKVRLIFFSEKKKMDHTSEISRLRELFFKKLNTVRQSKNKEVFNPTGKIGAKVNIRLVDEDSLTVMDKSNIAILYRDPLAMDDDRYLQGFWFFTTRSKNEVAYVGYHNESDRDYVVNLTHGQAKERKEIFMKLWEKLDNQIIS